VRILPWFRENNRTLNPVTRSDLQSAITDAVRKSDPACASFVGVIVRSETPKSRLDANWAIRGIKFGTADRDKSSKAIATIVERMQREFKLSEDVKLPRDR
jgi:hypothetical protein